MAIRGLSVSETEDYISPSDPGNPENPNYVATEKPTVFHLKNLRLRDKITIGDMTPISTMSDDGITLTARETERRYMVVSKGLAGWSNLLDSKGVDMAFATTDVPGGTIVSNDTMAILPGFVILELAAAILERNGMTDALQKKLEEGSLLPPALSSLIGSASNAPTLNGSKEVAPKKPKQK